MHIYSPFIKLSELISFELLTKTRSLELTFQKWLSFLWKEIYRGTTVTKKVRESVKLFVNKEIS